MAQLAFYVRYVIEVRVRALPAIFITNVHVGLFQLVPLVCLVIFHSGW